LVGGIDKSLFEFSRVIGSAFTAAIGVHHLWFPLLFSGNYFVHNSLHSPDGTGLTLTDGTGLTLTFVSEASHITVFR
jgi:hypothetical protein